MTNANGLIRYDKNVANDVTSFTKYYGHSEEIVRGLSLFFSFDLQHGILKENLFGRKILDPVVFASVSKRKTYRSLVNKVPDVSDVAQFKEDERFSKMPEEELKVIFDQGHFENEPLYVSKLDNALYLMFAKSLTFSKPGKTATGVLTSELKSIRFLKYLKKFYDKKTKKTYYEYELTDEFMNNLARVFLKLDYNVYNDTPRAYQNLYIYLVNYRERVNTENQDRLRVEIQFDHLCRIVGIDNWDTEQREKKKYLNKAFQAIQDSHQKECFFTYSWVGNGKFKYTAQFDFIYTESEMLERGKLENSNRLKLFLELNLKKKARELAGGDEREMKITYHKMLLDQAYLYEVKHRVAIDTYQLLFGREPTNAKGEVDIYSKAIKRIMEEIIPALAG
jgi:hypothetical protein